MEALGSCYQARQLVSSELPWAPPRSCTAAHLALTSRELSSCGASTKGFLSLALTPGYSSSPSQPAIFWSTTLRSEDLAGQMKEMAAAEKRWRSQVRDGTVRAVSPKQAGYALQLSDHTLLDVRPSIERNKAWVKDSVWIPIFDVEKGFEPGILIKKFSNFTMGGWWSGIPLMKYNDEFMQKVTQKIPRESSVIVVCQKGLRSLAACEQLYKAGYKSLFWVEGGLDAAQEGDLVREGSQPFKFAGIGGVSEFLGWSDEQRAAGAKEGWTYRAMFFARLVGIVVLMDALFIGAQQLMKH